MTTRLSIVEGLFSYTPGTKMSLLIQWKPTAGTAQRIVHGRGRGAGPVPARGLDSARARRQVRASSRSGPHEVVERVLEAHEEAACRPLGTVEILLGAGGANAVAHDRIRVEGGFHPPQVTSAPCTDSSHRFPLRAAWAASCVPKPPCSSSYVQQVILISALCIIRAQGELSPSLHRGRGRYRYRGRRDPEKGQIYFFLNYFRGINIVNLPPFRIGGKSGSTPTPIPTPTPNAVRTTEGSSGLRRSPDGTAVEKPAHAYGEEEVAPQPVLDGRGHERA